MRWFILLTLSSKDFSRQINRRLLFLLFMTSVSFSLADNVGHRVLIDKHLLINGELVEAAAGGKRVVISFSENTIPHEVHELILQQGKCSSLFSGEPSLSANQTVLFTGVYLDSKCSFELGEIDAKVYVKEPFNFFKILLGRFYDRSN